MLDQLSKLEASRLAGTGPEANKDLAKKEPATPESDVGRIKALDSAKDKSDFESDSNYTAEDSANKNVAGMW